MNGLRIAAFLLASTLIFPAPTCALRTLAPEPGSRVAAGLEEELRARQSSLEKFVRLYGAIQPVAANAAQRKEAIRALVAVSQQVPLTDRIRTDSTSDYVFLDLPAPSEAVQGIRPTQVLYDRQAEELYTYTTWGPHQKRQSGLTPVFLTRRFDERLDRLTIHSGLHQKLREDIIVLLVPNGAPVAAGAEEVALDGRVQQELGREQDKPVHGYHPPSSRNRRINKNPTTGLEEGIEKLRRLQPILQSILEEGEGADSVLPQDLQRHREEIEGLGIPYEQIRSLLLGSAEGEVSPSFDDALGRLRFALFYSIVNALIEHPQKKGRRSLVRILFRASLIFQDTIRAETKRGDKQLNELLAGPWGKAQAQDVALQTLRLFGIQASGAGGLEERVASVAAREQVQSFLSGLEEAAPHGMAAIVFGKELQKQHPGIGVVFAGLEEKKVYLVRDDQQVKDVVVRLIEARVSATVFVGLEEEATEFLQDADLAHIDGRVAKGKDLRQIFLAAVSQAAGLEEAAVEVWQDFNRLMAGIEKADSQA